MQDRTAILEKIRKNLFHGPLTYTKNQPDLFMPHKFQIVGPRQGGELLRKAKENLRQEELLVYVHVPFCFSECIFCNSFPHKVDAKIQQDYLRDLLQEIEIFSRSGIFEGKKAKALYFGGGTPTSFASADLRTIIEAIRSHVDFSEKCSITTEAHPLTLANEKRVAELAAIGITRISIGCQTFDPGVLELCNRTNTEPQIARIVRSVQAAGLAINMDMMTGLPGQTLEGVRNDLRILEKLRPDAVEYIRHEIVNPLAVELYKDRPDLMLTDDELFEMVLVTQEWMGANGYEQNGRFSDCRQWEYRYHWLHEMPIIAFGLRARSYTGSLWYDNHQDLPTYSLMIHKGAPPAARSLTLTTREQMYRTLFLSLQLRSGLDVRKFQERFHENPLVLFGSLLAKLQEYGCIEQDAQSVRLTQYGAWFVEDVCDYITDVALREESNDLVRSPHSTGTQLPTIS